VQEYLVTYVNYLITALNIVMFARVLSSWIPVGRGNPLFPVISFIHQVTEPILAPIRQIIRQLVPGIGMFDFSPMVALFLLWGVREIFNRLAA